MSSGSILSTLFAERAGKAISPFYSRFCKKYSSASHRNKRSPFPFCMVYKARPSRDAFIHCKLEKGETLMKNALVRILTLATLATSLSAFAAEGPQSNQATANKTTVAAANTQQAECAAKPHKEKKQKKAKSQRDDRTEQEKEFDHVLMGYFGG